MLAFSRFLHNHPHPLLLIAVMLGVGSGFLLPDQWRVVTQVLVAWNIMVWSYLLLTGWLMLRANHIRMLKIASQEDKHGATILAMFSIVTVASLVAIVLELSDQELLADERHRCLKCQSYFMYVPYIKSPISRNHHETTNGVCWSACYIHTPAL